MKFLLLIINLIISVSFVYGNQFFPQQFRFFIKNNYPEMADKLLASQKNKLKPGQLKTIHTILAESYFKNAAFDKALHYYKLSGNLEKSRDLAIYNRAVTAPSFMKLKYIKKCKTHELVARVYLSLPEDPSNIKYAHKLYKKVVPTRLKKWFKTNNILRAELYVLENIKYMPEDLQKECFKDLGIKFFRSFKFRDYERAENYLRRSDSLGEAPSLRDYRKGRELYDKEDYKTALNSYKKGGFKLLEADVCRILAIQSAVKGKNREAEAYLKRALNIYRTTLMTIDTAWIRKHNKSRLDCIRLLKQLDKSSEEKRKDEVLKKVLKGASLYCKTLDEYAIYYYCKERVHESVEIEFLYEQRLFSVIDYIKPPVNFYGDVQIKNILTTKYYDYQIIKEDGTIKESRKYLGRLKLKHPDRWYTRTIVIDNFFYGPIGLLHKKMQHLFNYTLLKENGKALKRNAWVISAIPLNPGIRSEKNGKALMFGKIWIDKEDFSILKIEWSPRYDTRAELVNFIAQHLNHKPVATFTSEFKIKKGALRYPSAGLYEEFFITKKGTRIGYARLKVDYIKYRFFNTAASIEKENI